MHCSKIGKEVCARVTTKGKIVHSSVLIFLRGARRNCHY